MKGRSLSWLAGHIHEATVLLHNAVHGRQSQPGPSAHFLRGEKWLEDSVKGCRIHSHACVGNGEQDISAGLATGMSPAKVFSDLDILGLDDDASALRHGILRVQTEIHEHLFDLRGIRHRHLEVRCEGELQFGLLSYGSVEETRRFRHQTIQVETSRLQDLATRKRQQLPGQSGRVLRLIANSLKVLTEWAICGHIVISQLRPADNDAQRVVEIVSNASGKPADGLKLL